MACTKAQPRKHQADHTTDLLAHTRSQQPNRRKAQRQIPHEAGEREPTGTQPKVSLTVSVDAPPEEADTASHERETERKNRGSEQVENSSQKKIEWKIR